MKPNNIDTMGAGSSSNKLVFRGPAPNRGSTYGLIGNTDSKVTYEFQRLDGGSLTEFASGSIITVSGLTPVSPFDFGSRQVAGTPAFTIGRETFPIQLIQQLTAPDGTAISQKVTGTPNIYELLSGNQQIEDLGDAVAAIAGVAGVAAGSFIGLFDSTNRSIPTVPVTATQAPAQKAATPTAGAPAAAPTAYPITYKGSSASGTRAHFTSTQFGDFSLFRSDGSAFPVLTSGTNYNLLGRAGALPTLSIGASEITVNGPFRDTAGAGAARSAVDILAAEKGGRLDVAAEKGGRLDVAAEKGGRLDVAAEKGGRLDVAAEKGPSAVGPAGVTYKLKKTTADSLYPRKTNRWGRQEAIWVPGKNKDVCLFRPIDPRLRHMILSTDARNFGDFKPVENRVYDVNVDSITPDDTRPVQIYDPNSPVVSVAETSGVLIDNTPPAGAGAGFMAGVDEVMDAAGQAEKGVAAGAGQARSKPVVSFLNV